MCSFLHCEKKLRPKLEFYSAAALISVFGHHFDINTHAVSDQAKGYAKQFRKAFRNIEYLSPVGYYDTDGDNVTGKVHNTVRPPNLVFVLLEVNIPLQDLHESFKKDGVFKHQYFFSFPQSCKLFPSTITTTTTTMTPSL